MISLLLFVIFIIVYCHTMIIYYLSFITFIVTPSLYLLISLIFMVMFHSMILLRFSKFPVRFRCHRILLKVSLVLLLVFWNDRGNAQKCFFVFFGCSDESVPEKYKEKLRKYTKYSTWPRGLLVGKRVLRTAHIYIRYKNVIYDIGALNEELC